MLDMRQLTVYVNRLNQVICLGLTPAANVTKNLEEEFKMKPVPTRIVSLMLGAFLLSAFSVLSGSASAKEVNLTYSNFFPPSHVQSKLAQSWCEAVEKRTNGEVKISYYAGNTLVKAAQIYDGVVTGRTDIGMSCLLYTRGRFPLMDVINLPFGNPSGRFATAVFNELYDQFKPAELSDTKVMFLHAHGPGLIHTQKKEVKTMADLKGLKLRSPGSVAGMIKALGATPVSMPMPEVYQALQKGVVEGAVYPEETNKGWKMGEVTDYTIACYPTAYSVGFFVVMNQAKWDALSDGAKTAIQAINHEWAAKHGAAWDESDYEGVTFSLGLGNAMIGIAPDEALRWKEAVTPVFDTYLEKTEKRGVPGQEALKFLNDRLDTYNQGNFESSYL
ncbi:TRAP-type C4-dicarboxylate transport system, periplasmic component [Desulforapulum autotrophicum HRM2]|uniref:TRAP-type C4-dicarboxylate transport system, periplasmic component n=2 Tax=Desulforapulum autotrophicum TaxID=2296 RepID=C0Q968_DESAH|nr:TRAP-type C4-dicarboxylate transport system, periplasmic component [Desulforapulum autotrophicum HRM2]